MTVAMLRPSEEEIQKVMKETGMDYLQAYRHLQSQIMLKQRLERAGNPYPLGKSAHFE